MRVAVHEAGHYHAARGLNLLRVPRLGKVLDPPAGPNLVDPAVTDENRAVANQSQLRKLRPPPRPGGPPQGQQLACAANQM